MADADVTLTDYGLAILCGALVWRLWRARGLGLPGRWLMLFFAGIGATALLGGTVHGFFDLEGTRAHDILWPATLLAIGVAAFAAWGLGARLVLRDGLARGLIGLTGLVFLTYAALVLAGYTEFRIAILHYLPATVFLLLAVVLAHQRRPGPGFRLAAAGLVLSFVAAVLQQLGVGVHPEWLDHNALYHVIEGVALVLLYAGMTRALARP